MNIQCITHADFKTPGVIGNWATKHNHRFTIRKPYLGQKCDDMFDFLIIMGGPQSPLNIAKSPYLKDEIAHIRKAIDNQKIVLGFCLGAQLIGAALGAKTEKSPQKEIGVYPIELNREGIHDPLLLGFPQTFKAIHWHNDMPGLTKESVLLAFSAGYPRQIIRYEKKVYGFQCHLESLKKALRHLSKHA